MQRRVTEDRAGCEIKPSDKPLNEQAKNSKENKVIDSKVDQLFIAIHWDPEAYRVRYWTERAEVRNSVILL
jgi:hypothetical protein